jgi:hypothetical protein
MDVWPENQTIMLRQFDSTPRHHFFFLVTFSRSVGEFGRMILIWLRIAVNIYRDSTLARHTIHVEMFRDNVRENSISAITGLGLSIRLMTGSSEGLLSNSCHPDLIREGVA